MALGACHLSVQAGQRVASFGVIELAYAEGLPIFEVVALLAVLSESSGMRILVAGSAGG